MTTDFNTQRRMQLLIERVADYAIYLLNPDGTVASWNAGARRFKGYTEAEIIGQHFSRFYTPADRAAGVPERALRTALEAGRFEAEGHDWAEIARRGIDDLQHLGGRGLLFQGFSRFIDESRVLNCDYGLRCEVL